jgi:large subunit ribosomal protein L3
MKGMIGKKIGMTRQFDENGRAVPVTVIQAGPCVVTQVKTVATDGYDAVQIGFGERKPKNTPLPMQGHFRKTGLPGMPRVMREFPTEGDTALKPGDTVGVSVFDGVAMVDVTGVTKGRGFAGTIKRWNFHRGPDGHGSKNVREPGSIGMHTKPGRTVKGKKLPGHYGAKRETKKNLTVFKIDPERNLLLVKGSVPGSKNGIVYIRPSR